MYPVKSLRECLLDAAADGNLDRLMMLLKRKDFDKKFMMIWNRGYFKEDTPISVAVEHGHSHIVEAIVKYYTEATYSEAGSPMLVACMKGTADCARIIFKSLPHLRDSMNIYGYHFIHVAAFRNRSDIVEVLLELGVDVNQMTCSNKDSSVCNFYRASRMTALDIASGEGYTEVVKTLLKHGADPLKSSSKGSQLRSALSPAASNGHIEVLKILTKLIPLDQDYGSHAVWSAAEGMNLTCLEYLLDNGATFNLDDEDRIRRGWKMIIDHPKPDFEISTRMIEILLENGVSMKPLAATEFLPRQFMNGPVLKILLASGLFEMMYSKAYQTLNSDHCARFASDFYEIMLQWYRTDDNREKIRRYTADRLRSVTQYLPYSFISAQRYFGKQFIDDHFCDENLKKFPSLQELCRWKIRCQIVSKQGYISQKLLSKLGLPKPLQTYLFGNVSRIIRAV